MRKILLFILLAGLFQNARAQIDWIGEEDGKIGFVDANRRWVINPVYDGGNWHSWAHVGAFVKNKTDATVGAISQTGEVIIPQGKYDVIEVVNYHYQRNVGPFYLKLREWKGRYGLADLDGKVIVPCKFDKIDIKEQGILADNNDGTKSVWSYEGRQLASSKSLTFTLEKEFIKSSNGRQFGAYTYDGEQAVPCNYEDVQWAADGIFIIKSQELYGYYALGREVIPCIYYSAKPFVNDVAIIKKDGEVRMLKNPLKDASLIITDESLQASRKKGGPVLSRYPPPDSDVDKDIPESKDKQDKTFAFIICNENYPKAPVPYALNDGRMFREYCLKTLGLPQENVTLYEDATFANIIQAIEKMKQTAKVYDGEASLIIYYAGHGYPDEKKNTAYLLPVDGNAQTITTSGYSLSKLYKELSLMKVKSSVVFLDACFSGAKREDQMLVSARGIAIKVKEDVPQGKVLVFSAAQGDETAYQYEAKHHGLFTYHLLKALQSLGGNADMGTLTERVIKQVKRQSVVINNKLQTPTVTPSAALTASWRQMKLK